MTYTTISGDTWDMIAFKLYGNEYYCGKIMEMNRGVLNDMYMIFPAGVVLNVPEPSELQEETGTENYPEWRGILNG